MRPLSILAVAVAAALAPAAFAQEKPIVNQVVGTAPGKAGAMQTVKASAVVEAVDPATRHVTLKLANGTSKTIAVGDQVKNFDQIKVGDKVTVGYLESFTLELKKGGKEVVARTEQSGMDRAKPGEKPGGVAAREVKVVADVVAVDQAAKTVTLKGPQQTVVLAIQDPAQMKLIHKGDQVEATYTEALAISMDPAAPAPAAAKPAPDAKKK
ncbi:MAG TPA: hypothetical protein VLT89_11685 [Usitatibacter sp.]|nr:hypothetical protein [Usitatibacter sp.]